MNNTSSTKLNELNFYINADKGFFISDDSLLDNNYKDIAKLLKLDEKNPVFKIGDNPTIILDPYFDDDGQFYCYPLKQNLQDESETQQNFLKIMYDKWLLKKPKSISISETHWLNDDDTTIVKYNTENIRLVIGFSPKYSVYPNTYALPEEQLPEWVQEWIFDDSDDSLKIEFLAALEVQTETSDIVKLRNYLVGKTEPKIFNFAAINNNLQLLLNTLKWLYDSGIQFKETDGLILQMTPTASGEDKQNF